MLFRRRLFVRRFVSLLRMVVLSVLRLLLLCWVILVRLYLLAPLMSWVWAPLLPTLKVKLVVLRIRRRLCRRVIMLLLVVLVVILMTFRALLSVLPLTRSPLSAPSLLVWRP